MYLKADCLVVVCFFEMLNWLVIISLVIKHSFQIGASVYSFTMLVDKTYHKTLFCYDWLNKHSSDSIPMK